jgi:predicted RND superfamily exporter protein
VAGSFGLATLLPDPAVAAERIAAPGPTVADQAVADFRAALGETIFQPAAYEPYAAFLRRLLTAERPPTITDLRRYPSLANMILPASSATHEAITLVFMRESNGKRDARDSAIAAIRTALSDVNGATLTGLSVMNHDTEIAIQRDLPRLVLFSVAIVAIYLAFHFRDVIDCLRSVLQTLFSLACLLAFMRLTGQKLNMVNLVAFPLLIGIDVDYGVFTISAVRRRELRNLSRADLIRRLAPAASAIVLCAAAAILGFGSLAFTSVPAVRSLGIAVAVGVASSLAGTFLLVIPVLFLRKSE